MDRRGKRKYERKRREEEDRVGGRTDQETQETGNKQKTKQQKCGKTSEGRAKEYE